MQKRNSRNPLICRVLKGFEYLRANITSNPDANITKTQAQEEMLKLEGKIKLR
jgi:hypothetical protein